jgi:hypothetical protein
MPPSETGKDSETGKVSKPELIKIRKLDKIETTSPSSGNSN